MTKISLEQVLRILNTNADRLNAAADLYRTVDKTSLDAWKIDYAAEEFRKLAKDITKNFGG